MESIIPNYKEWMDRHTVLTNYTELGLSGELTVPPIVSELIRRSWTSGDTANNVQPDTSVEPEGNDGSLEWVAGNLEKFSRDYPADIWLLVKNCKVVAAGSDLAKLVREVDERGIKKPLIINMEQQSSARRTAYATWFVSRLT